MTHFLSSKGIVFSLEAVLALLVFGFVLTSITANPSAVSYKELLILEQQHDLLRVWSAQYPTAGDACADILHFLGRNTLLTINKKIVCSASPQKNAIASSGVIVGPDLQEMQFEIVTYYN